nr:phosphosulfolactate synthase [Salinibacter altiplanensis]
MGDDGSRGTPLPPLARSSPISGLSPLSALTFTDPHVFPWYTQNYGPEVNLFVDHSQIVQLECLRSGIWGPHDLFGRVQTFKDENSDGTGAR